jgi:hypothetical protein
VKNIKFLAPIELNDQFRCTHYQLLEEADEDAVYEESMSRINNLGDLMPQIRPLFQGLQDSQLRSFQYVQSREHISGPASDP